MNPYLDTPRIEGGRRFVQGVDKADALRDGCNLHWRDCMRALIKILTSRGTRDRIGHSNLIAMVPVGMSPTLFRSLTR